MFQELNDPRTDFPFSPFSNPNGKAGRRPVGALFLPGVNAFGRQDPLILQTVYRVLRGYSRDRNILDTLYQRALPLSTQPASHHS